MMAVVAMLLHRSTELPAPLGTLSPWLDYGPTPFDQLLAAYGAQTGRRLIKTHTPLDGIPLTEGVHAISVSRNPIDAMRSMRRHVLNMRNPPADDPYLQPEVAVIGRGIEIRFNPENIDDVSLELLVHHMRVAEDMKADSGDRVLLVHYSDMKRDLASVVRRVAEFIEAETDSEILSDVVQAASFSSMRANAGQFVPLANASHFSSTEGFFAAGEERGNEQLAHDLKERYEERLLQLLARDKAQWLQFGGD